MTSSVITGSMAESFRASSLRGYLVPRRHARTVNLLTPSIAATCLSPFSESQFLNSMSGIVHDACAFAIGRVHNSLPAPTNGRNTLRWMATNTPKNPVSVRIGRRVAALRKAAGWSLEDLAHQTKDRLPKSRLSNYEQGTRRLDIEGASILAELFKCSAAHVLCLDDEQPVLGAAEAALIADLRRLPPADQQAYARRIATLALAYGEAVPDEAVLANGFASPKHRKVREKKNG